jgi:hypothetical protein
MPIISSLVRTCTSRCALTLSNASRSRSRAARRSGGAEASAFDQAPNSDGSTTSGTDKFRSRFTMKASRESLTSGAGPSHSPAA